MQAIKTAKGTTFRRALTGMKNNLLNFERLRCLKGENLLGGDFDSLLCRGIDTLASSTLSYRECAEAEDGEFARFDGSCRYRVKYSVKHFIGVGLAELYFILCKRCLQLFDEFFLGHDITKFSESSWLIKLKISSLCRIRWFSEPRNCNDIFFCDSI